MTDLCHSMLKIKVAESSPHNPPVLGTSRRCLLTCSSDECHSTCACIILFTCLLLTHLFLFSASYPSLSPFPLSTAVFQSGAPMILSNDSDASFQSFCNPSKPEESVIFGETGYTFFHGSTFDDSTLAKPEHKYVKS